MKTVGLLGNKQTMVENFYRNKLEAMGIEAVVPEADDRAIIDRGIPEELLRGER